MTNDPRDPTKPSVPPPLPGDPLPGPTPIDPEPQPPTDPEEPALDRLNEKEQLGRAVDALDHDGDQREDQPLKIIGESSDEAREKPNGS